MIYHFNPYNFTMYPKLYIEPPCEWHIGLKWYIDVHSILPYYEEAAKKYEKLLYWLGDGR